ncbi:MBL fold metallo-hydrolase [bacterium]|nr:MBL fold metallo-hydrolase [bacterium]MCI0607352.1 MBL fold metallo-hydrolase [bacterium]
MFKAMITFIFSALFLFVAVSLVVGYSLSTPRYSGAKSDHFNGKRFFNMRGKEQKGFGKWMLQREQGEWSNTANAPVGEKPAARVHEGIRITFVNHSTFLIQADGLNILTDPIWSERSSPFSWAGPKRVRQPGIRFEDLPEIDTVLLSHNHYDHLDLPTLKKLFQEFEPVIIAPLGINAFLEEKGIPSASEADWWDEMPLNSNVTLAIVPAQHFSGRGLFDRNATLWGGYILKTKTGNLYFAGDTGYDQNIFQEIGKRYAPLRAALLPIGAYKPLWFMSPVHISPEEAVNVHLDLKSEISIAMHYGTFPLGDDGQNEPVNDLKQSMRRYDIGQDEFLILKEGSSYEIARKVETEGIVTVA